MSALDPRICDVLAAVERLTEEAAARGLDVSRERAVMLAALRAIALRAGLITGYPYTEHPEDYEL